MVLRVLLSLLLPASAARAVPSFVRDIVPILVNQCVECHRAGKVKGGYRLDTWQTLQKAGDSESSSLTPGQPDKSEIYRLLVTHDEADRMPKKSDPLPAAEIELIQTWIKAGAAFDGDEKAAASPLAALMDDPQLKAPPERYPRPLPVSALALSADGATVAVSGYHEVTLWDSGSGKLLQRLPCPAERILGLAWVTPKDSTPVLLAAGGTPGRSGSLWRLDPAAKSPPLRLLQTRDTLHRVVVTPDGLTAVTAGAANSLYCLSLPSGKILWESEAHSDWVMDLALSPDGKHLASASRDRTARLIEVQTGVIDATFTDHSTAVTSAAFATDGKSVFTGSANGEIRNWNFEGEGIKDTTLKPGRTEVTSIAITGTLLTAALADGRLIPLDLSKRAAQPPLLSLPDRLEIVRAWRRNDSSPWMLLAGGHDGTLHRLHLPPPAPQPDLTIGPPPPLPVPPPLPAPLQFIASPGW